jgi:hypothetical protein
MGKITHIIIHCSASEFGCVPLINKWHKERGFREIGYSYVILNGRLYRSNDFIREFDGTVEVGRHHDGDNYLEGEEIPAHALGMNSHSLGICLIGRGEEDFTEKQLLALYEKVNFLMHKHDIPIENVIGHYESEFANGKTCPNTDMDLLREKIQMNGIGA